MWVKLIIDCVPVSPFIRIRNQVILVRNLNPATLECEVEAFPEPSSVHWERGDGRRLKPLDKYRIEIYDKRDIYKVIHLLFTYIHENFLIEFAPNFLLRFLDYLFIYFFLRAHSYIYIYIKLL